MKLSLKKIRLICFFGITHFFMPFVFVQCGGEDIAYIVTDGDDPNLDTVDQCAGNEFLTQACSDQIADDQKQQQADQAAAEAAASNATGDTTTPDSTTESK